MLAVTPAQIRQLKLPTHPEKTGVGRAVELDAIPPNALRQIVRSAIERHMSREELDVLRAAEESEREIYAKIFQLPSVKKQLAKVY